jgi:uncharacterized membrane protein YeaQ/YmgE (transglycosylase-associated protein family)
MDFIGDFIFEIIGGLLEAMVGQVRNPFLRALVILMLIMAFVGCIVLVAILVTR